MIKLNLVILALAMSFALSGCTGFQSSSTTVGKSSAQSDAAPGSTPAPTATATPPTTATATPSPSPSATPVSTPLPTATPRPSATATPAPTATPSPSPSATPVAGNASVQYDKTFYDPTAAANSWGTVKVNDTLDLGEVPVGEIGSQSLSVRLNNSTNSPLTVVSSALSNFKVSNVASVPAHGQIILSISPTGIQYSNVSEAWTLTVGATVYKINLIGRVVP